jgi:hypothetical protein
MKKQASVLPFGEGDSILIRTVTHYHVGRVTALSDGEIVLADASWIADTERFGDTLTKGDLRESERCPSWVVVMRSAIVDVFPWDHPLPDKSICKY